MHNLKKYFLLLIIVIWTVKLCAQVLSKDSVLILDAVKITSDRLYNFSGGQKLIALDSSVLNQYIFQNASDLIIQQTFVNVKTYGSSMLSNIGIRGNASNQTGVFWNGININASNIGMTDFSLLPVFFFDKIEMQYGGGSSLFGNGCIGGSFHFFSDPVFNKKTELTFNQSMGSYNDYATAVKIKVSGNRLYSATSVFYKEAKNNFEYINEAKFGKPPEELANAEVMHKGINQELAYKINDLQKISVSVWLQNNYRQIPGTMTTGVSNAKQYDNAIRTVINWNRTTDRNKLYVKVAGLIENEHFIDSIIDVDSQINISNQIFETGYSQKFNKNIKLDCGFNNTLSIADIESYNGLKKQNKSGFFMSYNQLIVPIKWTVQANIRYELIKGYKTPVFPSFGLDGRIWKFLHGKLNVSKNFRVPTLNDIYWQPGGNPNLKPEESINEEATLIARFFENSVLKNAEVSLTAYHSIIDNSIQWLPTQNVYWAPQNLRKVRGRGLEAEFKTGIQLNKAEFLFNCGYAYTSIMNINKISVFDDSYNKQLIYVPFHKVFFNMSFNYRNIDLHFNHVFTGKRYTMSDNSKFLPYYNLSMLSVSYSFKIKKFNIASFFKVDNLWDETYQIIQWRPMPGRNYRISLTFKFNNN